MNTGDAKKLRRRNIIIALTLSFFLATTLVSFVFALYQHTIAKTNERLAEENAVKARHQLMISQEQALEVERLRTELEKCQASKK